MSQAEMPKVRRMVVSLTVGPERLVLKPPGR